jgi:tRNA G18 (ribose-2'-O)-methylase SpoU
LNEALEIRDFAGLRDRDYAARGLLVLEGRILLEKAMDAGLRIGAALCVPADVEAWQERSMGAFPVFSLPSPDIEKLAGYPFHRGILALAHRPRLLALDEGAALPAGHLLVLWNVTDAENLGLLARSAAALGAKALVLGPNCADPFSRKGLRASMGNVLTLPLFRLEANGMEVLRGSLGADGTRSRSLAAAALGPRSIELRSRKQARSVALFLGNEGFGLPQTVVEACDESLLVPMAEGVDSLNVAAAGAIMMWELFRA